MILIFSNDSDQSAIEVSKWLEAQKSEYSILKQSDINSFFRLLSAGENFFFLKGKVISFDKVSAIWFRRGGLDSIQPADFSRIQGNLKKDIEFHLSQVNFQFATAYFYNTVGQIV